MSKVALVCLPVYAGIPFILFGGSYPEWNPGVVGIRRESGLWSSQEVTASSSLQGDKVDISDGNDRPEKVRAGGHSLGIRWECDPLHSGYLERLRGRDCDI